MTLCTAWIRKQVDTEELVFATDSTLTGGEKWNSGVKLFELPRRDCLICFAGYTIRAYPMILNLISELRARPEMQNHHLDVRNVAGFIAELFSNLLKNLTPEAGNDTLDSLASEASFLFGGWSWQQGRFCIWSICYDETLKGFTAKEETTDKDNARVAIFLGNPTELGTQAEALFKQKILEENFYGGFDMEPAKVLAGLCQDSDVREVDGAPQIGKIYKSGTTQFFGIRWPSSKGNPTYLGREFNELTKPKVRYFNPDTFELVEEELPLKVADITEFSAMPEFDFIQKCYYQPEDDTNYYIKTDLSDLDRQKLISVLSNHTYTTFLTTYNNEV